MTPMALAALKIQHKNFIQSLFDEGVLDGQFAQIQALQDATHPNFVNELITLFCKDAERLMTDMNKTLANAKYEYSGQRQVVIADYTKLNAPLHQLRGSSSSVGAQRMKLACNDLRQASDDKNWGRCIDALNKIIQEYCIVKKNFQTLFEMENNISAIEKNISAIQTNPY